MNVTTNRIYLNKVNDYLELLEYAYNVSLPGLEDGYKMAAKHGYPGMLSNYEKMLYDRKAAVQRIENRYKHLVSQLNKLAI